MSALDLIGQDPRTAELIGNKLVDSMTSYCFDDNARFHGITGRVSDRVVQTPTLVAEDLSQAMSSEDGDAFVISQSWHDDATGITMTLADDGHYTLLYFVGPDFEIASAMSSLDGESFAGNWGPIN